jgi:hypothetical protein
MAFFQNVFDSEFRADLFSSDRRLQSLFIAPPNKNTSMYMLSYNKANSFDLTGNTNLKINYAYDPALIAYAELSVDVSGAVVSETKPEEVVAKLNLNPIFSDIFLAVLYNNQHVLIKTKKERELFKAYISNTGAETVLKFNAKAPVVELPNYFKRYSFDQRFSYQDLGSHRLVLLDESDTTDAAVIAAWGLDPLSPTPDWKLLNGRNDAYWFYKKTYSAGKLQNEIKYPAGAKEGDLAMKTHYEYSGSDLVGVMETPYVLTSSDLITPP